MPELCLIEAEVCQEVADVPSARRITGEAVKGPLISILILVWFLLHSWRGLLVYFTNDDIMNLYWAREIPFSGLVLSALVPFTTVYRPTGAVFYRCLYALFGLQPLPFRIVFYALLVTSLVLLYKVTVVITGQRAVGALAAFMASFHSRFSDLYLNNGTIYDVLCACFYLGALLYYISIRSRGRTLSSVQVAALYLLVTLALNAKEMAATLPMVLLAYELMQRYRQLMPACVVSAVMLIGAWARFRDASRLMHNDLYALHLNLGLSNTAAYLNDLFYLRFGVLNELAAILIIAGLFGIAALARSKVLLFWAVFIVIAPLPVLFIPHRGLFAFYLPVLGWAVFAAALVIRASNWIHMPLPVAAMLVAGLLLIKHLPIGWAGAMPEANKLHTLQCDLLAAAPRVATGARILFRGDCFPEQEWIPLMLARLTYNDLSLTLVRSKVAAPADIVFDCVHGRMIRVK